MTYKLIILAGSLLFLAGCSAHYRHSLAAYRRNEPTPFLQSTLAWANDQAGVPHQNATTSNSVAVTTETKDQQPRTTLTTDLVALRTEFGQPDEAFIKVVARVFALTPEEAANQLAPLRDEEVARKRLAGSLDWETLRLALALHNPAVRAGRQFWQASLRQFEQADYLEALISEYRTFTRNLNVEPGNQNNRQMVQTFFPFPSVIALKGEMMRWMARMAHEEWQMTLRDQVVEAGQAYYEYQYLTRAIAVSRENIALVKDLLTVVEEGYASGSGSQTNVVKLQTTLARQANELRDMESMRAGQIAKMNASLGRESNALLGNPDDKDYPMFSLKLDPLIERAMRLRQEIQMQQAKVERSKAAIRMGEIMNRPLASQGNSLLERGMMAEAAPETPTQGAMGNGQDEGAMSGAQGENKESFGLRPKTISRPLYAQAESYLAEMRQRLGAEQAQLEQVIAQTRGQARMMLEELDVARREVELMRGEVLPKNEFTFYTARSAYTSGDASFLDMLDAERMLLEARIELQKARRDQNKAALNLAMVAGQLILP